MVRMFNDAMVSRMDMMVGLSATEKLDSRSKASWRLNVLNVNSDASSLSSSSTEVGIEMIPPNVVRWVVEQTMLPSRTVLLTPSLLHAPSSSLQKLQSIDTEHCASMKPGGQTHSLHVYVCTYICIHVCVHAHACVCTHVHVCMMKLGGEMNKPVGAIAAAAAVVELRAVARTIHPSTCAVGGGHRRWEHWWAQRRLQGVEWRERRGHLWRRIGLKLST